MEEQLTPEQVEAEVDALEKKDADEQATLTGPVTEVTTIKQEEAKTPGTKVGMNRQEYIVKAMEDHIAGMKQIQVLMRGLSKKAYTRVLLALLKIPEEGVRANFQSNEERAIFGVGQRVLNARTTLIIAGMQNKIDEDKVKAVETKTEQPTTQTTSDNKELENGRAEDNTNERSEG
jgi:hypothetical protein